MSFPAGFNNSPLSTARKRVTGEMRRAWLPLGLSPEELAEQYFLACRIKDPNVWLATLHVTRRQDGTSVSPGPFDVCHWELGQTRVAKYEVHYRLISESQQILDPADACPMLTMIYEPLFGAVPGHVAGSPLGPEFRLVLKKEGGEAGEWRVLHGTF